MSNEIEVVLCWTWGVPSVLVLGLRDDGRGLRGAFWRWQNGELHNETIGRA